MVFRCQSETVYVDAWCWTVGVMLIGLNMVEIPTGAFSKAVLAVELYFSVGNWVFTGIEEW